MCIYKYYGRLDLISKEARDGALNLEVGGSLPAAIPGPCLRSKLQERGDREKLPSGTIAR